jgi:uncharacterized protein
MTKEICKCCSTCCSYVTIEIDKPDDKNSWDALFWYVNHENVFVYIDNEDSWCVEFTTPCKQLLPDKKCAIYENRPYVCQNHDSDNCENNNINESPYKELFKTPEDIKKYMIKKNFSFEKEKYK